jgi:undecaprenyl-diphosphatase
MVALLVAIGLVGREVVEIGAAPFDREILSWLDANRRPVATRIALALDLVGIFYTLAAALLIAGAVLWRGGHRASAAFLNLGFWGAIALNLALKAWVDRPRPVDFDPLVHATNASFPSGHAMGSFAFALCVVLVVRRLAPHRFAFAAVVGALFAVGVGWSRVYLHVHYPSDVLAGWFASGVWLASVAPWYLRRAA